MPHEKHHANKTQTLYFHSPIHLFHVPCQDKLTFFKSPCSLNQTGNHNIQHITQTGNIQISHRLAQYKGGLFYCTTNKKESVHGALVIRTKQKLLRGGWQARNLHSPSFCVAITTNNSQPKKAAYHAQSSIPFACK